MRRVGCGSASRINFTICKSVIAMVIVMNDDAKILKHDQTEFSLFMFVVLWGL